MKDDDAAKLQKAHRIIAADRKRGNDYLLWALHLYSARHIYGTLLARGYIWSRSERRWMSTNGK